MVLRVFFASLTSHLFSNFLAVPLLLFILHNLYRLHRYITSPLRSQRLPGPFLAAFTHWYRAYHVLIRHNWHFQLQHLHAKYGPIVWVAPDEISVSDPCLRSRIYGFQDERKDASFFRKYKSLETGLFNEDFNFLFETDPHKARLGKKELSHPYSEKGLLPIEAGFDKAVDDFITGLEVHYVKQNKLCDLCKFCLYFMCDLSTRMCFNYSTNLCLTAIDTNRCISTLRVMFDVIGSLMYVPVAIQVTTRYMRKCLLLVFLERFFRGCIYDNEIVGREARLRKLSAQNPDHFVSKFIAAEKRIRRVFGAGNWTEAITNNVFFVYAGSTVTASALPRILEILYDHPDAIRKILTEVSSLSGGRVSISDLDRPEGKPCRIPYTEAAVLEALRLTPMFGLILSRLVPSTGCQLNQYFIPPGYSVGMSPWPTNYDKGYFGPDADKFRPERWLGEHPTEIARDGSGSKRTMRNYMEAGWLTFGAGSRVCIGRHMGTVVLVKAIPEFLRKFEVEIVKRPYDWFGLIVHSEGMKVRLTPREGSEN